MKERKLGEPCPHNDVPDFTYEPHIKGCRHCHTEFIPKYKSMQWVEVGIGNEKPPTDRAVIVLIGDRCLWASYSERDGWMFVDSVVGTVLISGVTHWLRIVPPEDANVRK